MTQLTIRGVNEKLHRLLKYEAKKQGMSLNSYLLKLIGEATGVLPPGQKKKFDDLDHLAGTWSEAEYDEFQKNLMKQRQVDEELWS